MVHEVCNLAEKKQISLEIINRESLLFTVQTDRDKTKQIITNLIGNAIKFTDQGAITIFIEEGAGLIFIKIKDTGKGIPLANQNLLFRKFQQTENNLLTRETNSGTIFLEQSEENKGSTFAISLPKATTR